MFGQLMFQLVNNLLLTQASTHVSQRLFQPLFLYNRCLVGFKLSQRCSCNCAVFQNLFPFRFCVAAPRSQVDYRLEEHATANRPLPLHSHTLFQPRLECRDKVRYLMELFPNVSAQCYLSLSSLAILLSFLACSSLDSSVLFFFETLPFLRSQKPRFEHNLAVCFPKFKFSLLSKNGSCVQNSNDRVVGPICAAGQHVGKSDIITGANI
mmetsp:Transcript_45645/g.89852  ORF Transcript_45645/g.89852 Transcript_45645/m.89852 type:complete len:209 (+) Transcript_45645:1974-2600(+)